METTVVHGRLSCTLWGHIVDNELFRRGAEPGRRCRCGMPYLQEDGTFTHVRHTLSCFLRHHTYVRLADRDGAHEYVCGKCGHPLVYPAGTDPFTERQLFTKKVRYLCGVFGHRVQEVAVRNGFTEYACHCGHSFLKATSGEKKIRHPLLCFFRAHRVRFLARRCGYTEYVCEDCGHPFCFADAAARAVLQPEETEVTGTSTTEERSNGELLGSSFLRSSVVNSAR